MFQFQKNIWFSFFGWPTDGMLVEMTDSLSLYMTLQLSWDLEPCSIGWDWWLDLSESEISIVNFWSLILKVAGNTTTNNPSWDILIRNANDSFEMLLTTCVTTTNVIQQYFKTKEWSILNGTIQFIRAPSQLKMSSYDFLYPKRNQDKK